MLKISSLCIFLIGVAHFIAAQAQPVVLTGAERIDVYLPQLLDKKVGVVVNQTSVVSASHLVDTLLRRGVQVTAIYAPEHGYRGTTERGKPVVNTIDSLTGIPVYSIYGSKKKPAPEDLRAIDILVFDMQDVGARFFTYISTMHYIKAEERTGPSSSLVPRRTRLEPILLFQSLFPR